MSAPALPDRVAHAPSSAVARVRATRRALLAAVVARAALWGAAAALVVALAWRLAGGTTSWMPLVAAAAAVLVAAVLLRGARVSLGSTALWIEARVPELHYALVTLVDLAERPSELLERRVRATRWDHEVRAAAVRALWPPALAIALIVAGVLVVPRATDAARSVASGIASTRSRVGPPVDALARVQVVVTPPAYTGLAASTVDDPGTVAAIEGSAVELRGPGAAEGLTIGVESVGGAGARTELRPVERRGGWRAALAMPARPAVLRLAHAGRTRLLVLDPRADSLPLLTLTSPARDTVLRVPDGTLALAAVATDDIGLAEAAFEYIVSSGEGESFTFRSGRAGVVRPGGARRASLGTRLVLDSLALKPGDIVHLRAVARDRNPAPGRGAGASETRTLRVARAGEYDSVAVEGAPPPDVDKGVLSQRMLLMLTEALEKRRPRIPRATLLGESRRISADQARLRKQVSDIVFSRLGDDPGGGEHEHFAGDGHGHADTVNVKTLTPEQLLAAASRATGTGQPAALDFAEGESPVVAVNRPLLEAYNHMWDAGRALDQGEPRSAIPPMRLALAAIQRARSAERIYLRGRAPAVVVDVDKVRLQGKDTAGVLAVRGPRTALDAGTGARARRIVRALALAARTPSAGVDSLSLVRIEVVGDDAPLAAALGAMIDAVRAGRDAAPAAARVRAALLGDGARAGALGGWSGW